MEQQKEDLSKQIKELGDKIKQAKTEKKPKEEWDPLLQEMLAAKAKYEEVTGEKYGASEPKKEKPKQEANQQSSEKNKAKNAAKAAAKAEKEAKKEANRKAREERERQKAMKLAGIGQDNYGDAGMITSKEITNKKWTNIEKLTPSMEGLQVLIRGNLQASRSVGKGAFILLRSGMYSVQCVAFEDAKKGISRDMVKFIVNLALETVVDVKGIITKTSEEITSATQGLVELNIESFYSIAPSQASMPLTFEDASRPEDDVNQEGLAIVGQDMRLNNRWIDLRTPANQAIFRIQSTITMLFRQFLTDRSFMEIRTPKIIPGASEGGSEVFKLDYFGTPACLSMSPQLHKQILAACSGFEKVYEVGPVFRAENSNTRRHLCEFTGMDLEMTIKEHYYEVLDLFSDLFIYIFDNVAKLCKYELQLVSQQYPFEPIQYTTPTLKLTFQEGCALLQENGINQDPMDDLSTENEKVLGNIVKKMYNTDFFFMDKYPLSIRPFYTMPDPANPKLSNSYDFFIRGQEILSGAQRIHDPTLLVERAKAWEIPLETLDFYIQSFQNGALPHGGGGIGLERVTMLYLDLSNIRKATFFPRDPKRVSP